MSIFTRAWGYAWHIYNVQGFSCRDDFLDNRFGVTSDNILGVCNRLSVH